MSLDFYYRGGRVGSFSDRASFPRAPGVYTYVPYRSVAHKRAGEESSRDGFAWCSFRDGDVDIQFKARVGFELYRVEILEIVQVTCDTPAAVPASGRHAFDLARWSIIPGPATIHPPFLSIELDAIKQYPADIVAATVLALPGAHLIHEATPDWWSWVARWPSETNHIDLAMTLFEWQSPMWGGFKLSGSADPSALLDLYTRIRSALPATWLHDDACTLHDAASFAATVVHARR